MTALLPRPTAYSVAASVFSSGRYRAVIRARRPWLVWFPWYAGSPAMALVIVTETRNAGL
ncbi:hypothetical protein Saa2_00513 [Streptomyces acidiscabies]|nr:hypothetical protein Saa2_00513 [Streptomyces acidiscabies]